MTKIFQRQRTVGILNTLWSTEPDVKFQGKK